MRKISGLIAAGTAYLIPFTSALAQTRITIAPPPGSGAITTPVQNVPQFIISLLFVIGIVAAIAFLIYGGIKWILSGGDKQKVSEARSHIVAAIVGLIIVVLAFFILNVVITVVTGNSFSLDNFCIPTLANARC